MATIPDIIGYARDREGHGVAATIEVYAITNLSSNTKAATAVATTTADSVTGRYVITGLNSSDSPTGFFSRKLINGSDVRWVEGDVSMQATTFFGEAGQVPIADGAATDAITGTRTIDDTTVPASDTGTITALLSGLANRVKTITGQTGWKTAAAHSLVDIWNLFSGTSGHNHTGTDGEGPLLDPRVALSEQPLYPGDVSSGGGGTTGTVDQATNADNLRQIDGRFFTYLAGLTQDGTQQTMTNGPWKMQAGTNAVFTNGAGQGTISFPAPFTQLLMVMASNGDSDNYRNAIVPQSSSNSNFTFQLAEDISKNVRVNWFAIGR